MAHSFISRFAIRPEKTDEFVQLCHDMEAHVRANEPGTLFFKFYRLDEPHMFAVIESFPDEVADAAHQEAPAAKQIIEKMINCMGPGGYVREFLRDLA